MLNSVIDCLHANEQQTQREQRPENRQKKCNNIRVSQATQIVPATTKFHFALYIFAWNVIVLLS